MSDSLNWRYQYTPSREHMEAFEKACDNVWKELDGADKILTSRLEEDIALLHRAGIALADLSVAYPYTTEWGEAHKRVLRVKGKDVQVYRVKMEGFDAEY
jgi:hypothetical protein